MSQKSIWAGIAVALLLSWGGPARAVQNDAQNLAKLDEAWQKAFKGAREARQQGDMVRAAALYQEAIQIAEQAGPESFPLAVSLSELGDVQKRVKDFPAAYKSYGRAVPMLEKLLSAEGRYEDLINVFTQYASFLDSAGKPEEKESAYRRVLIYAEKRWGPDAPELTPHLQNLAYLIRDTKPEEAEGIYARMLANLEKKYGPDAKETLEGVTAMGDFYVFSKRKDYAKAEPFYRRQLAIAEKTAGPESQDTRNALSTLAINLSNQAKYPEAEKLYLRLIEIDTKAQGHEDPLYLSFLGSLYVDMKRYAEAEAVYKRAMDAAGDPKKERGGIYRAPDALRDLGRLYQKQQRYSDAEASFKRALEIRRSETKFDDDPSVASAIGFLASLYDEEKKFDLAEPLFKERLEILERRWGADSPKLIPIIEEYAASLRKAKRPAEATPLEARAKSLKAK